MDKLISGKMLIAGGYAVINDEGIGISVSVPRYYRTQITFLEGENIIYYQSKIENQ